MVDLKSQYQKIRSEIDSGIQSVIDSTRFIGGPEVKDFGEALENYLDVKHVIPCANGTDALQIAMMGLGLQPGDELITSNFTYVATAEVIALLKLKPVLVDVDPNTFNIDPDAVRKAITPKTKAIVPVHLFGQSSPMEELIKIAREHNLYIIEDTAQAIGAEYTFDTGEKMHAGTIGDVGTTSFFPSKNLGCYGDGGAIFTNSDDLAAKIRMIANHGKSKQYYHDSIGVNSRLDAIQAAILNVKLKHLDEYAAARNKVADFYDEAFKDIEQLETPARYSKSTHVFHQYTLKTYGVDRFNMQSALAEKGVPSMVYYPVPLHLQKAYRDERYSEGDFPITEKLCSQVISLPMQTELDDEQLNYIVGEVKSYIKQQD